MQDHHRRPVLRRNTKTAAQPEHQRSKRRPDIPLRRGDQKLTAKAVRPVARHSKDIGLHGESENDESPRDKNEYPFEGAAFGSGHCGGKRHIAEYETSYAWLQNAKSLKHRGKEEAENSGKTKK